MTQRMVVPVLLALLIAEANVHHLHLPALFRGLQIDASDFDSPGVLISQRDATAVVRRLLKLLPLAERGLELGRQARITERGALALGQLAAATLGEAISLSVRFAQSAGYLLRVWEEAADGEHRLLLEPFQGDLDLQPFLVDLSFAAVVQFRRQITQSDYLPARVELVRLAPADARAHLDFFGCAVHFGCQHNVLVSHADWLAFRLPWAQVMAYRLATQLLEREALRCREMPVVGFSVERAIRRQLPEVADLAEVAASLNLSERTLRRKLAQQGLSYRQLLDESRRALAFELMSVGQRPMAEVAAALGFSDPRAFNRAFKRWTGRPPSQIHDGVKGVATDGLYTADD